MDKRFIATRSGVAADLFCIAIAVLLFIVAGCGDPGSVQPATDLGSLGSSDSGAASFNIQWHAGPTDRNATGSLQRQAIADCDAAGVTSITCEVYDEVHGFIVVGGPWPCGAHGGRIENISAGPNRTFAILGWNAVDGGGDIVYHGQASHVAINPGEITDAGTVHAYAFVPTGFEADGVSNSRIDLAWTISPEATGSIAGYRIYRDGLLHGTVTGTSHSDTLGLSPATRYCYQVSAHDVFGNESGLTGEVCAETTQNGEPVAQISVPQANTIFSRNIDIDFQGTGQDPEEGPLFGGALVWTSSIDGQIGTGGSFSSPLTEGLHTITLTAADSFDATGRDIKTGILVDYTAPSVPRNVIAVDVSESQITITWEASNDNVELEGYRIYRDDVLIGTSASDAPRNYIDSGLNQNTTYCYAVLAYDRAGNASARGRMTQCPTTLTSYTWYHDGDGDGYGDPNSETIESVTRPPGYVTDNSDCRDDNPAIYPGANEACGDQIDNNCNTGVDENCAIPVDIDSGFQYVDQGWPMGLAVAQTYAGPLRDVPYEKLVEPRYYELFDEFYSTDYGYLKLGNSADNLISFVIVTDSRLYPGNYVLYIDRNNNEDLTDDGDPYPNQGTGRLAALVSLNVDIVSDSGRRTTRPYNLWIWLDDNDKVRFYARCHYTGTIIIGAESYTAVAFEFDKHDALYRESGLYIDLNADGVLNPDTENFMDKTKITIDGWDHELLLNYP